MDPISIITTSSSSSSISINPLLSSSTTRRRLCSSSYSYPPIKTRTTYTTTTTTTTPRASLPSNPPSFWQRYTNKLLRSHNKSSSYRHDETASNNNYLLNGGLGVALLSLTTTAKVRISPFVATLAANPTFVSGFFAWLMAQSLKVVLHFCFDKKLDLRIMCSSGGMPSSHSSLCTALTTSVAICHGVADSLFPVCLGFTLIVMYDAIGIRRHAGMQAQVLNLIVEDLFQGHPISKRKLKELLGHTPSQVIAGALLGILVACFCCQGCFTAS
ncbi:uncharacterized protein LOC143558554 [Bidens hawaiensis]|uniref:uncharacterized protein LOC143558554 n=1 Tax=Bidens hawaiensis TaxID=980011 RepID=UPI0040494414